MTIAGAQQLGRSSAADLLRQLPRRGAANGSAGDLPASLVEDGDRQVWRFETVAAAEQTLRAVHFPVTMLWSTESGLTDPGRELVDEHPAQATMF